MQDNATRTPECPPSATRIYDEEIARELARRHLARQRSTGQRATDFLGSPFGLWILSSVVIGGLSFVVTSYSAYREDARKQSEQSEQMEYEVAFRVGTMVQLIHVTMNSLDQVAKGDMTRVSDLNQNLATVFRRMASFGLFTDLFLEPIATPGAMGQLPPNDITSLGKQSVPRLLEFHAKLSGTKDLEITRIRNCFARVAAPYKWASDWPPVFTIFHDKTINSTSPDWGQKHIDISPELGAIRKWLDALQGAVEKIPPYLTSHSATSGGSQDCPA